jgi:hypothetical protein
MKWLHTALIVEVQLSEPFHETKKKQLETNEII